MSVSVWVSKISFKTGFSGLGLGFHPWFPPKANKQNNTAYEINRKKIVNLADENVNSQVRVSYNIKVSKMIDG